jgi:hypothetical protein
MIMTRITLFQYNTTEISINIEAYFVGDKLVIEGYDIGKRVEEAFGDSDYEYSVTVAGDEVKKLYYLMQVKEYDKEGLLKAIADKYHSNACYSEFRNFLDRNGIKSEGFSWA